MSEKIEPVVQLRRYLADIPELHAEASHYLTPGSAPIDPTSVRGNTIFRLPIVPEIFDLLHEGDKDLDDIVRSRKYTGFSNAEVEDFNINNGQRRLGVLPTLGLWVSLVYAELEDMGIRPIECCPARSHTISGESGWLSEYAEPILELHPDFFRDVELLWTELRRACRVRAEYIPTCPVCATITRRWRLETIYGDDGTPAWWRCTGCAQTFVRDAEVKRIALTQPKMTLRQIASWLEIPLRTLHNWRTAGRFSTDSRGLVELEHVKKAAETVGRISA